MPSWRGPGRLYICLSLAHRKTDGLKVLVFRRVRKVAKNAYYIRHVCLSVRVAPCVSRATTWRISLKFDFEGSYENMWRKFELG
jgi:hypothetical protein